MTTEAAPTTATTATTAPSDSPSELNDQGFELMRAGDYEAALPLLEQAVAGLSGSGETAEAYATYNLAVARLAVGSCDGVVELLDRSGADSGRTQGDPQGAPKAEKLPRQRRRRALGGGQARCVLLLVVRLVLAGLISSRQLRCSTYHATVSAIPSSKGFCGSQPRARSLLVSSDPRGGRGRQGSRRGGSAVGRRR